MKKLIVMIAIMAMTAAAFSQFTAGFKLRSRMVMATTGSGTSADYQTLMRKVDYRLRPWFGYKINDMVSFKLQLELGDANFGSVAAGTDLGTDGKIIEVKHAYLNLTPQKECNVRFGLQSYYSTHGLIFDDDFAGLKYDRNFNNFSLGLGYFVTVDDGEANYNKETFSFGESIITTDLGFKINDKMKAGLTAMIQMNSDLGGLDTLGNATQSVGKTAMFFEPHFSGDFGMVSADLAFIYNMRSYSNTSLVDGVDDADAADSENGIAFSLKTKIKATDKLLVGVDFVMNMGDDDLDDDVDNGFQAISSYYLTPLKIMDADTYNFWGNYSDLGLMMPTIYANFMLNKKVTLGGVFGMAMLMNGVGADEDTDLGMEFGLNGKIKVLDAVAVIPYASFFMPGVAYVGGDSDADTDMQMKVGMTLKVKF